MIKVENITKSFNNEGGVVDVLHGISYEFKAGSLTAIMGASGSGKSTFLTIASGLDKPCSGSVFLEGQNISNLNQKELDILRREKIGFIFQSYNLLPMLTVYGNVVLPLQLAKKEIDKNAVLEVLERVGLQGLENRLPSKLSGGQQQRVAIARTLIQKPKVLFADEPTGALDSATSHSILELLKAVVTQDKQTVIMVTHDVSVATIASEVVFLKDGRVGSVLESPTVDAISKLTMNSEQ